MLVDDWKQAPRWLSVQFGALLVAWGSLPAETQAWLVGQWVPPAHVPALLGALVILGRVLKQSARDTVRNVR